jgi:hypothetical protein
MQSWLKNNYVRKDFPVCEQWNNGPHSFPSAASAALITKDTINKNPIPMIMPKDSTRARNKFQMPLLFLLGALHMRSSASCDSPNTVVAALIKIQICINVMTILLIN